MKNLEKLTQIEALLKEMIELQKELKPKIKKLEEIKAWCKEQGSFSTENYVCVVEERNRRSMVSIEKASDILGGPAALEASGLVQMSCFKTVHVGPKTESLFNSISRF